MNVDGYNRLRAMAVAIVSARMIAERFVETAAAEALAQGRPLVNPKLTIGLMMALREIHKHTPVDFDKLEAMEPEAMNATLNASLIHMAPDGTFTDGHVPEWLL